MHAPPMPNAQLITNPTAADRWLLTVHDVVQIALANSRVVRNLGLQQAQSSDIDKIRAVITQYDPAAAAAQAEAQWGIFDPVLGTTMQWYHQDIPPGVSFSGIGARPPRLDTADFDASISQLLPTGGTFRADYITQYLLNPDHPVNLDPNPQYFTYSQFGLNQPLLQGSGSAVTLAPIRIASAKAEQTDWRFKQEILALVRSVETAYWSLYAQQQNLKAIDNVLPMFREIVRIREQQSQAAAGTETEVAQARSDMLLYEQQRFATLSLIAEQQLVLRDLMGLSLDDNRYMVLVAVPAKTPPLEPLATAVDIAVNRRPDILRQRLAVYVAQQETVVAGDKMRPILDFGAFWRINGLGEDLGSSIEQMDDNRFNDWQIGLGFQVPLGRRQAKGNLRAAQLTIEKQRALLDQAAHQTSYEVADAYRRTIWLAQQQRVADDRVAALTQWGVGAKAQFENPPSGMSTTNALQLYLQNLRDLMDAIGQVNAIMSDFNSALARLEEVKGTLLERELVEIDGDGTSQLPPDLPVPQLEPTDSALPPPSNEPPAPATPPAAPATESAPRNSDSSQTYPRLEQAQPIQPAPINSPVQPNSPPGSGGQVQQMPSVIPQAEQPVTSSPVNRPSSPYANLKPDAVAPAPTQPAAPAPAQELATAPPTPAEPPSPRLTTKAAERLSTARTMVGKKLHDLSASVHRPKFEPKSQLSLPESVRPAPPEVAQLPTPPMVAEPAAPAQAPEIALRTTPGTERAARPIARAARGSGNLQMPASVVPESPSDATEVYVIDQQAPEKRVSSEPSVVAEAPRTMLAPSYQWQPMEPMEATPLTSVLAPNVAAQGNTARINGPVAQRPLQLPDSLQPTTEVVATPAMVPAPSYQWQPMEPMDVTPLSSVPVPQLTAHVNAAPMNALVAQRPLQLPDSVQPTTEVVAAPLTMPTPSYQWQPMPPMDVTPLSNVPAPKFSAQVNTAPMNAATAQRPLQLPDSLQPMPEAATASSARPTGAIPLAHDESFASQPLTLIQLPESVLPEQQSVSQPAPIRHANAIPIQNRNAQRQVPTQVQLPESMLPSVPSTATRTSWQPTAIR